MIGIGWTNLVQRMEYVKQFFFNPVNRIVSPKCVIASEAKQSDAKHRSG